MNLAFKSFHTPYVKRQIIAVYEVTLRTISFQFNEIKHPLTKEFLYSAIYNIYRKSWIYLVKIFFSFRINVQL